MLGSYIVAIALVRLLCLGLLLVVGGLISPLATVPPLQAPQSLGVMTIGWLTVTWLPWLPPALEMASLQLATFKAPTLHLNWR